MSTEYTTVMCNACGATYPLRGGHECQAMMTEARVREICVKLIRAYHEDDEFCYVNAEKFIKEQARDDTLEEAAAFCEALSLVDTVPEARAVEWNIAHRIRSRDMTVGPLKSPPAAEARPASSENWGCTYCEARFNNRAEWELHQGDWEHMANVERDTKPAAAQESEGCKLCGCDREWVSGTASCAAIEQERDRLAKERDALISNCESRVNHWASVATVHCKERDEARGQSQRLQSALDAALDGLEWVGRTAKRDDFEKRWNTVQDVACGASWKARRIRSGEEDCRLQPKEGK